MITATCTPNGVNEVTVQAVATTDAMRESWTFITARNAFGGDFEIVLHTQILQDVPETLVKSSIQLCTSMVCSIAYSLRFKNSM